MKKRTKIYLILFIVFSLVMVSCSKELSDNQIQNSIEPVQSSTSPTILPTVTSDSTPIPKATVKPTSTNKPATILEPISSSTPNTTTAPSTTFTPTATTTPVMTITPTESPTPITMPIPTATVTQTTTSVPTATSTPTPTAIPINTIPPINIENNLGSTVETGSSIAELNVSYLTIPNVFDIDKALKIMPYLEGQQFMPVFVGMSENSAISKIEDIGILEYELTYLYDELAPAGYVIYQNIPGLFNQIDFKYHKLELTISNGPDPVAHSRLVKLCDSKQWPLELWPYIISAGKNILKSVLTDENELINRLENRINNIAILSPEESANVEYKGYYNLETKNIGLSCFYLAESTVAHEILHALSTDLNSRKTGISHDFEQYRKAVEAYTDYLADMNSTIYSLPLYYYKGGANKIRIASDTHMCNGPYNSYLSIYSSFFILVGKENMMKAYLGNIEEYNQVKSEFNNLYGADKWDYFLELGQTILDYDAGHIWDTEIVGYNLVKDYYKSILECMDVEYASSLGDNKKEKNFLLKLYEIDGSIPQKESEYKDWFFEHESALIYSLYDYTMSDSFVYSFSLQPIIEPLENIYTGTDRYKMNYVFGRQYSEIISTLYMEGGAKKIYVFDYTKSIRDPQDLWSVSYIMYRYPNGEGNWIHWDGMTMIPMGMEYYISVVNRVISTDYYYQMEDLVTMFEGSKIEFDNMNYGEVLSYLKEKGIEVEIEYLEIEGLDEEKEGQLVYQFPAPNTAVRYGGGKVILTFLKKL